MLIEKTGLDNNKVLQVYRGAFMDADLDSDGDVRVKVDGLTVLARATSDRPFFVLTALFTVKPGASRRQVIDLCNRVNDHMIMIRCSCPEAIEKPVMYVDHWTMTEGGISAEEIVAATRRFASVIFDGFEQYDTESILH